MFHPEAWASPRRFDPSHPFELLLVKFSCRSVSESMDTQSLWSSVILLRRVEFCKLVDETIVLSTHESESISRGVYSLLHNLWWRYRSTNHHKAQPHISKDLVYVWSPDNCGRIDIEPCCVHGWMGTIQFWSIVCRNQNLIKHKGFAKTFAFALEIEFYVVRQSGRVLLKCLQSCARTSKSLHTRTDPLFQDTCGKT